MLHGPRQTVFIDTIPPGGTVVIDDSEYATPAHVSLSRCRSHRATATTERGALTSRVILARGDTGIAIANFLAFPILGHLIDAATGSECELSPTSIVLPLPPADAGPEFRSIEQ